METSVDKCLAFCQSLIMSGQKFSFTLTILLHQQGTGPQLLHEEEVSKSDQKGTEKKRRALSEATEKVAVGSEFEESGPKVNTVDFQCSHCDSSFKAEEDL